MSIKTNGTNKEKRMPKSVERPFKLLVIVLLAILAGCAVLFGFTYLTYQIGNYQRRHIDCDPEQLLSDLERVSHVNFPDDIQKVKAAATVPIEGDILFILKFTCKADILNTFLESFPNEPLKIELEAYKPDYDLRKASFWPPPSWFTEVIEHGKEGALFLDNRRAELYIDTTNEKSLVVYIRGSYSKRAAEQSQ